MCYGVNRNSSNLILIRMSKGKEQRPREVKPSVPPTDKAEQKPKTERK